MTGPEAVGLTIAQRDSRLAELLDMLGRANTGPESFHGQDIPIAYGHAWSVTLSPKRTRPMPTGPGVLPVGGIRCSCGEMSGEPTMLGAARALPGGREPEPVPQSRRYPEIAAFAARHLIEIGEITWARQFAAASLLASVNPRFPDDGPDILEASVTGLPAPVARAHAGIAALLEMNLDHDLVSPAAVFRLGTDTDLPGYRLDGAHRAAIQEVLAIGYRHAPSLNHPDRAGRTIAETATWLTDVLRIARATDPESALCAGIIFSANELAAIATDPATIDPDAVRVLYGLSGERDFDYLD